MAREERPGLTRAVVALRYPNYRLFYVALLVSAIGGQLQTTANLWQIYELTGSALHLGLTGLARAVPVMALSLMGGVIADRVDRRRFVAALQVVAGGVALALALLTFFGQVDVWHIYAATVAAALIQALGNPARTAMVPNLVPRHHLLNALALNQSIYEIGMIVGPSLGGLTVAGFGLGPTYLGNGVAHLVTVAALLMMQIDTVAGRARQSPLQSLREGLAFVRQRSIILTLLLMDSSATLLGSYRALLPLFAAQLGFGAQGLGFLMSAPAIGALLGGAVLMSLGNVRYKGLIVAGGIFAYCVGLVVLALSPWFVLSLLACGLLGFCDSVQRVPRATVIQTITPDDLRGRVTSFQFTLTSGSPALGQMSSGVIAAAIGASGALVLGACACAAVILGFVIGRRDLRDPELASSPEPGRAG